MNHLIKLCLALCIFVSPVALAQQSDGALVFTPLEIQSGDQTHEFRVELADSPEEIAQGLMFRTEMAADAGMVFDFGQPREAAMYMRNCLFPQDMLFLDPTGRVVMIARHTIPGSERTISPGIAVKGVLELNAGRTEELNIQPGDIVRHDMFGNLGEG